MHHTAARHLPPHSASAQSHACRLLPSLARLLACHDEEVQHNAAWAVHALAKHSPASREALLRCSNLLPAVLALLQHPAQPVASAAITAVAHFAHEPTSAVEGLRLPSMAALAEQLQQLLGSPSPEAQEGASAAVVSLARTSEAHAGLLLQQKGLPGRLVELMSAGTGTLLLPCALRGQCVHFRLIKCRPSSFIGSRWTSQQRRQSRRGCQAAWYSSGVQMRTEASLRIADGCRAQPHSQAADFTPTSRRTQCCLS